MIKIQYKKFTVFLKWEGGGIVATEILKSLTMDFCFQAFYWVFMAYNLNIVFVLVHKSLQVSCFVQSTQTGQSDLWTFTQANFDETVQLGALGRTKNDSSIIDRLQGQAVKDRKSVGSRFKDISVLCNNREKEGIRHQQSVFCRAPSLFTESAMVHTVDTEF